MVLLYLSHRTVPSYRHSFLVNEDLWITTRIPLYYLDLEVSNETLFKEHYEKVFPNKRVETDFLSSFNVSKQRFHFDDISVGCEGRWNSNLFYTSATATTHGKLDKIAMRLFVDFLKILNPLELTCGESAVKFLKLATLFGYQQWKERIVKPHGNVPYSQPFVNLIFNYIYPSILKGVYQKKDENHLLVKKFWDLFCLTDETQRILFMKVPDAEHLKFMLEVANRMQFDFWSIRYGGKGLTDHIFVNYITENRCDLIQMMVEYGFTLKKIVPCESDQTNCSCHNPQSYSILDYTSEEFNQFMMQFLVRCSDNCSNLIKLPGFIEVYQKLSRSLPLPSLPPSIFRKHLQSALDHRPRTAVEEMTAIYETCTIHPPDSDRVTPPKLSHLSRCVIRERLAVNYQLPTSILDSRLPTLIKRFLSLEF